jgi:hypothetical protein
MAHPTKAVWAIADEMKAANPAVTRKQVVDECVRRGIALYTARTQSVEQGEGDGCVTHGSEISLAVTGR